jgi:hypothetical protein
LTGPILSSSLEAKAAASGVFLTSGGERRLTSRGTKAMESRPGARPAMNQPAQVTSKPKSPAMRAASGLEAWPVKNMAQLTTPHW